MACNRFYSSVLQNTVYLEVLARQIVLDVRAAETSELVDEHLLIAADEIDNARHLFHHIHHLLL